MTNNKKNYPKRDAQERTRRDEPTLEQLLKYSPGKGIARIRANATKLYSYKTTPKGREEAFEHLMFYTKSLKAHFQQLHVDAEALEEEPREGEPREQEQERIERD